jgi:hypothetical protein
VIRVHSAGERRMSRILSMNLCCGARATPPAARPNCPDLSFFPTVPNGRRAAGEVARAPSAGGSWTQCAISESWRLSTMILFLSGLISGTPLAIAANISVRFAETSAELIISEVSERTVRIELLPLNEAGRPISATPSTVLVPFSTTEKLRVRDLDAPKELRVGPLRVAIKTLRLTVSVRRPDNQLVQELTFDGGTNGVTFRTDAPVLGLGEGAQQFDRRALRALVPVLSVLHVVSFARPHVEAAVALGLEHRRVRPDRTSAKPAPRSLQTPQRRH